MNRVYRPARRAADPLGDGADPAPPNPYREHHRLQARRNRRGRRIEAACPKRANRIDLVPFRRAHTAYGYPASAALVGLTVGGLKLFPGLADSSVALLLLLSVFLSAWIWESGPGAFAAVIATLAFNFFFLPPLYTLTVDDPRNVAALVVFLVSGLLIDVEQRVPAACSQTSRTL